MMKTKILGSLVGSLLIVCGLLLIAHNRATDAKAALQAEIAVMEGVLAANEEALAVAVREKENIERIMAQRLAAQKAIQVRTETELREASKRLAQLRAEYEDIKNFLSLPVPPAFVDYWMRGRADDNTNEG